MAGPTTVVQRLCGHASQTTDGTNISQMRIKCSDCQKILFLWYHHDADEQLVQRHLRRAWAGSGRDADFATRTDGDPEPRESDASGPNSLATQVTDSTVHVTKSVSQSSTDVPANSLSRQQDIARNLRQARTLCHDYHIGQCRYGERCRYFHGERIENALVLDEIRRKYKARNEPAHGNKVGYESTVLPNHYLDGCLCKYCKEEARYGQESY
jgi:hypothetical protein